MVSVIDVSSDEPAGDASYENVGGEVLLGEDATDADGAGEAVDRGFCEPSGIFAGDDGGHRPSQDGVVGREGTVVPAGAEEVSGCVVDGRTIAAKDELKGFVDGETVGDGFGGEQAGFLRLRSVIEEAPEIAGCWNHSDSGESAVGQIAGFFLIAGVEVNRLRHGVLIACDEQSGCGSEGDKPDCVLRLDAKRAGPDNFLVAEQALRHSDEIDVFGLRRCGCRSVCCGNVLGLRSVGQRAGAGSCALCECLLLGREQKNRSKEER